MKESKSARLLSCKALFLCLSFVLCTLYAASCRTTRNQEGNLNQSEEKYSHNTIIVYFENGTDEEEIRTLAEKHNLKVLYIYKNFSASALFSEKTLSDPELNALISEVEKEQKVLSAQKDYIMSLD